MNKLPLLRVAFCLANLTSPKVEDGIAKCITTSDIKKLTSKTHVVLAEECDGVLKDAIEIVAMTSDAESALKPLGQIFVRVGLFATDKAEKGLEGKKLTMDEIKAMFLCAMSERVGKEIKYDQWKSVQVWRRRSVERHLRTFG